MNTLLNKLLPGKKFGIGILLCFSLFATNGISHNSQISVRDSNMLLGNPSNATTKISEKDNYLLEKKQYSLSYNNSKGEPNWVSWHLNASWKGEAKRCNCFNTDLSLPELFYKVKKSEYTKTGFDRGHLCPSDDRDATDEDNEVTFFMSNMIPQSPHLNRITWVALEEYCRKLIQEGKELYIIAGGYGSGGIGSNNSLTYSIGEHINVPSHCWKIIVVLPEGNDDIRRITNNTRVIAVNMPNNQTVNEHHWDHYRTNVDEIEKITGYDFLNKLPKEIQNHIEAKKDQNIIE
jgi:endonuclease G